MICFRSDNQLTLAHLMTAVCRRPQVPTPRRHALPDRENGMAIVEIVTLREFQKPTQVEGYR